MAASEQKLLIAGSRKSQLATIQTECITKAITGKFPHIACKIETMSTIGDQDLNTALPKIGEKKSFYQRSGNSIRERKGKFSCPLFERSPNNFASWYGNWNNLQT